MVMVNFFQLQDRRLSLYLLAFLLSIVMVITITCTEVFAEEISVPFIIGSGEFSYDDGVYYQSSFRFPHGVAYSEATNSLIIVDTQNHRIRQLDLATNKVTSLAGTSTKVDRFGFPAGGHKDGDADKALFNRPRGVAIAPKL